MSTLAEVIAIHEAAVEAGWQPAVVYRAGDRGHHWAGIPALYVDRVHLVRRLPAFRDGEALPESEGVA
jgi:hypothetical protein